MTAKELPSDPQEIAEAIREIAQHQPELMIRAGDCIRAIDHADLEAETCRRLQRQTQGQLVRLQKVAREMLRASRFRVRSGLRCDEEWLQRDLLAILNWV